MSLRQWTVDSFASAPFTGNPACVVAPFDAWPSDGWMQRLAQENNQAETAYLVADAADPARFGLRWFTPAIEAPFCGHATLAAAHVLFTELGFAGETLIFRTRYRGEFRVSRSMDGYRMDFPADPPVRVPAPEGLASALGVEPLEVWAGQYLLALVTDEATVRGLTPDIGALAKIGTEASSGPGNIIVAAPGDAGGGYNGVSRFFGPGSGIAEDPVTGSAHTLLGPVFAGRLGRGRLRFHQAFPGRGGDVGVELSGDRAILTGQAVTMMETILRLAPG